MNNLLQDIRYSLRFLRKSPGFTAVAVLTLALGIGANTAIFSVINSVLLRSLPFPDSDRLVKLTFSNPGVALQDVTFSYPEFDDVRAKSGAFDQISVVWPSDGNLTGAKVPVRLELLAVSPNYFSMLGVVPELGRLFGPEDVAPGFAQAAVISDALWRRSYGADPGVIGRTLQIDNDPYVIVGVAPRGFHHPGRTVSGEIEVWLTAGFSADPFSPNRSQREIPGAMARLKPGLTIEQAQAQLDTLANAVQNDFPVDYSKDAKWSIAIQPLQRSLVGDVRPTLLALMGAAFLIILLASVNMANLLLARASGRQQEIAVRVALGANRSRLVRQTLTESLLLSLIAGIVGTVTAAVVLQVMLRLVPQKMLPRVAEVGIDWRVLVFALGASIVTGLMFGLAPAIQSMRVAPVAAIREGGKGSGFSVKTSRLRSFLIISEISLAAVLMVGAGLLLRTFWGLLQENPGFNPSSVVGAGIWLPAPNDPKTDTYVDIPHQTVFLREVLRRVREIPGVQIAAMSSALPASGAKPKQVSITIEGRPTQSAADKVEIVRVSPEYFKVLQTPLLEGRFFDEHDDSTKEAAVITDQSAAKRYWPGEDPVGKQVKIPNLEGKRNSAVVVGMVQDIKHDGLDKDGVPHLYMSIYQSYGKVLSVAVRTSLPASLLEPQIRGAVQAVDPNLPVFGVKPLSDLIDGSLAPRRFSAELVGSFALLALVLASIGIYGLLAYMVGQRSTEIGIRMALGARRSQILQLFLRNGLRLAGAGIGIGLLVALIAAPMIASLLYGVRPLDIPVFVCVPLVLLGVSLLASLVPALRAAQVEPVQSLREG